MVKRKRLSKLKPKIVKGYYMIPKGGLPPKSILEKLELKPLNIKKFRRKKNGKAKASKKS